MFDAACTANMYGDGGRHKLGETSMPLNEHQAVVSESLVEWRKMNTSNA